MELDGELEDIDDSLQQLRSLTHALEAALQRKGVGNQDICPSDKQQQLSHNSTADSADYSTAQCSGLPADDVAGHSSQNVTHVPADNNAETSTACLGAQQATGRQSQLLEGLFVQSAAPASTTALALDAGSHGAVAKASSYQTAAETGECLLYDPEGSSQRVVKHDDAGELAATSAAEQASFCSSSLCSDNTNSQLPLQQTLTAAAAFTPIWRQQIQHEQKQKRALVQQQAQNAAKAAQQLRASQQEAAWKAAQQHSPFKPISSSVAGAKRTLKATLSGMLRDAAAGEQSAVPATEPADTAAVTQPAESLEQELSESSSLPDLDLKRPDVPTSIVNALLHKDGTKTAKKKVVPLLDRYMQEVAARRQQQQEQQEQQQVTHNPEQHERLQTRIALNSSAADGDASLQLHDKVGGDLSATATSIRTLAKLEATNSSRKHSTTGIITSAQARAQDWATADAVTDAEVAAYLRDHWQQQYLPAAALILQCAWRNRAPRLMFNRYIAMRRRNAAATLSPAFVRWQHWTAAGCFYRCRAEQQAFRAWRELLLLRLQFCRKVIVGLQRGALSSNTVSLLSWRMCTPVDTDHSIGVRPSFGGLLGNLLKQRLPRLRFQAYFHSWLKHCRRLQASRATAHKLLTAAVSRWHTESIRSCLAFWHMYTIAGLCERLHIALPVFGVRQHAFETWLWQHERGRQMRQQATTLYRSNCLRRHFGGWRAHAYRVHCMRLAWSDVMLLNSDEMMRCSMNAFKANWKEQKLQHQLQSVCFCGWSGLSKRNVSVAAMRRRLLQAADYQSKRTAITAFKRYTNMCRLISTAGTIKLWQARPLALAHLHAWMHDNLHMTVYLLWWRWRRRAVGRLRIRAAIGLHMYRSHWLAVELALTAWRKVTALAKSARQAAQLTSAREAQEPHADELKQHVVPSSLSTDVAEVHSNVVKSSSKHTGVAVSEQSDHFAAVSPPSSDPDTGHWHSSIVGAKQEQQHMLQEEEESQAVAEEEDLVFVSLADSPADLPWRPLASRAEVVAQKGLQHLSGARLAKVVRDLRELEGRYIVKDHDRGAEGLLGDMMYNKRRPVSSGLKAIVISQLPMTLLWQATTPGDCFWWQRVVGLVQQHAPHPDSWKCFISNPDHRAMQTSNNSHAGDSCINSTNSGGSALHTTDDGLSLLELLHGNCCRVATSPSTATTACLASKADGGRISNAASMVGSSRLSTVSAPILRPPVLSVTDDNATSSRLEQAYQPGQKILVVSTTDSSNSAGQSAGNSKLGMQEGMESAVSAITKWPEQWRAEDVAWLCQIVQAEELLETAVFMLLGIGCDSSEQLYETLGRMSQEQGLDMQGDLLVWLLSTALAHDSAHSHKVLLKARARDNLIVATMEMRQRAIALHLHFPWKFTLSSRGPVRDIYAVWKKIIKKIEAERDWDADSSDEEDTVGSCSTDASIALLLQQLQSKQQTVQLEQPVDHLAQHYYQQQQLRQQEVQELQVLDSTWQSTQQASVPGAATSMLHEETPIQHTVADQTDPLMLLHTRSAAAESAASVPTDRPQPPMAAAQSADAAVSGTVEDGTAVVSAVLAAAGAAAASCECGVPSLSPGSVLDRSLDATEQLYHLSQSSAPVPSHAACYIISDMHTLQQNDMSHISVMGPRQQSRASQHIRSDDHKQRQRQQATLAATVGLFGPTAAAAAAGGGTAAVAAGPAAVHGSQTLNTTATGATAAEEGSNFGDVFTVPVFASLSGGTNNAITSFVTPTAAAAAAAAGSLSSAGSADLLSVEHPELLVNAHRAQSASMPRPQSCCGTSCQLQHNQPQAGVLQRKLNAPVTLQSSTPSSQRPAVAGLFYDRAQSQGTHISSSSKSGSSKQCSSSGGCNVCRSSKPGSRLRNRDDFDTSVVSFSSQEGAMESAVILDKGCSWQSPSGQDSHHAAVADNAAAAAADYGLVDADTDGSAGAAVISELQHVLQSVLAPTEAAAAETQQAAAGLAEACASWLIDLQQQQHVAVLQQVDAIQQEQQQGAVRNPAAAAAAAASSVSTPPAAGKAPSRALSPSSQVSSSTLSSVARPVVRPTAVSKQQQDAYAAVALTTAVAAGFSSSSCGAKAASSGAATNLALVPMGLASGVTPQSSNDNLDHVAGMGLQDMGLAVKRVAAAVTVSGISSSSQKVRRDSQQQQQQRQQQQQQQQQEQQQRQQQSKEVSRSSSSSSLPSIPSCASLLQQMIPHAIQADHKGRKEDVQLPAISTKQQQQQQLLVKQQQQQQPSFRDPSATGAVAAADEALKAVWQVGGSAQHCGTDCQVTAAAAAATAALAAAADPGSSTTPTSSVEPMLQQLLQDAVKEDWQQFEAVAQQLAARITAAMQARHAAHRAAVTVVSTGAITAVGQVGQRLQQQEMQRKRHQQEEATFVVAAVGPEVGTAAAAVADSSVWCCQPEISSIAVLRGATSSSAAAVTAAAAAAAGGSQSGKQVVQQAAAATAVEQPLVIHHDDGDDDLSDVLCQLMAGPLAARFAFWKGIVKHQHSGSYPATDLYNLAWRGLLHTPNHLGTLPRGIPHGAGALQQQQQQDVEVSAAAAATVMRDCCDRRVAHLKEKLQQYLVAYADWRCRLATVPPLAASEKWVTLEHEEQVLDFITGLTISVYQNLLAKHKGSLVNKPHHGHHNSVRASQQSITYNSTHLSPATAAVADRHIISSARYSQQADAAASPTENAAVVQRLAAEGHAVAATAKVGVVRARPPVQQVKAVPVFVIPGPPVTAAARVPEDVIVQQQQLRSCPDHYTVNVSRAEIPSTVGRDTKVVDVRSSPSRPATAQRLGNAAQRGTGLDSVSSSRASGVSSWND